MPTFLVFKPNPSDPNAKIGEVVETLKGADPQGLRRIIAAHASHAYAPKGGLPAAEAEEAKKKGNAAFAEGRYKDAVQEYTKAIELAPKSGVLYANRALAYIKLIQSQDTPLEERKSLRPKAVQDAQRATDLEERWGKAWVRMAEALLLTTDEEAMSDIEESRRAEGRKLGLQGAEEALENAIRLSEGKVEAEAQKMLEDVHKLLATT
ncbi:DnaJ (Hsp40), subfamily C, member 8, variant 2 [Stygiomarasmius scandens]